MQGFPQCHPCPKKNDGIDVLKVHKAVEHLKSTPVAMLSSSRKVPNPTDCYKDDMTTHGVKAVDFKGLVKSSQTAGLLLAAINRAPLPAAKGETIGTQHRDH